MAEVINVDITVRDRGIPETIDYVQGTNAVPIVFTFWDWTVPSGAEARIFVKKPSGKEVYNEAVISGNTVTVNPTTQMFAEYGEQAGQLEILSGGKVLQSFLLVFRVEKSIIYGSSIQSTNEYSIIDQLIEEAREAVTGVNNAVDAANTAASSANTAAGKANTAAGSANTAASSANTAAGKADSAASAANTAASAANQAKADADAAAERANKAAQACEDIASGDGWTEIQEQIDEIKSLLANVIATE